MYIYIYGLTWQCCKHLLLFHVMFFWILQEPFALRVPILHANKQSWLEDLYPQQQAGHQKNTHLFEIGSQDPRVPCQNSQETWFYNKIAKEIRSGSQLATECLLPTTLETPSFNKEVRCVKGVDFFWVPRKSHREPWLQGELPRLVYSLTSINEAAGASRGLKSTLIIHV